MPNYVQKTLKHLNHVVKKSPQHSPHPFTPFAYGKKGEQPKPTEPDTSPLLPKS